MTAGPADSTLARADAPPSASRVARFGLFELDVATGELRRGGVKVKLQEQPLRLLCILLEQAGSIVTREEVRTRLWPEEFVDFDHGLNTAVRKLRTALDDSADNPRFVETLARRGYRFIAPVTWAGEPAPPEPMPESGWLKPALRYGIAALVAVLVIAALAWVLRNRAAGPVTIESVAVLPFTNDDARNDHVSDGLTEIIIDRLSRLSHLRVMARSTVFQLKGKKLTPRQAGRELEVSALIMGAIRRVGDRQAIHVELIDVRDGSQIWGHSYTASAADLPLVQSRIMEDLMTQLRTGETEREWNDVVRAHTTNAQAYDLYLRGLELWNARGYENVKRSIALFEQAIRIDPQLAAAHAGVANAYGVLVGSGRIPPAEATPKILASAMRALELDPANAEAYTSLATTKFRYQWDFAGAEADYRKALALNPSYATGHQWFADLLRSTGRTAEARREVELAMRLDPLSPAIRSAMSWQLFIERRYADAIAFSQAGAHFGAGLESPHAITRAYVMMGDFEGALEAMRRSPTASQRESAAAFTAAYRRDGRKGYLRLIAATFERLPDAATKAPMALAETYALLGEPDRAFYWLDLAAMHRVSGVTDITILPGLDSLRQDPRYTQLVRRIGLPEPVLSPES